MNRGFTLIELMVVVLIIGILSAVALPQYQKAVEHARAAEALTLMAAVSESLQRYHSQYDAWPTTPTKLDVEIPKNTSCPSSHLGGKHYCLELSNGTVSAIRKKDNTVIYTLKTTITPNAEGTYTTKRQCVPASGNTEGQGYCNIITGNKNSDF